MIKRFIKRLILRNKADSQTFLNWLRGRGAKIGEGTYVFEPTLTIIDATRPYLINIGKNVQITAGVTILTHGYDWCVLKGVYGEVLGSAGEVVIGDNCFIGMNSTILKGVHIGKNCIIGANSLVNKDIPDGWVAAGNPAKPIMKIEDYYEKRKAAQFEEAKEMYRCYVESYGKEPTEEVFFEHFWLFKNRDEELPECFKRRMRSAGNFDYSMQVYKNTPPSFNGFEEFLKAVKSSFKGSSF